MKSTEPKKFADPFCIEFGKVLAEIRSQRGLSLEAFAVLVGVSRQEVRFIEHATHSARLDTVDRIACGLEMPASALMALAEERLQRRR